MQIYLSPLVCLAGVLLWFFAGHPKVSEAGKIAFFCGLLATLLQFAGKSFGIH
jgi:Na+/phosphate symporter